jgi:2-polyprenyl-3-methyl-5-hydroxy-6-metoxy-1,4-benzoquinol methylase
MNLKNRTYKKELLDEDNIPTEDLRKNLKELNFINTWLGGHNISIGGLKQFSQRNKEITICEIGCGGGDNIFALNRWCEKNNIKAGFIGIDIKQDCIEFAKEKAKLNNVSWVVSDYQKVTFDKMPDVIFSSLFCHHFTEGQLVEQLKWMKANSTKGFFINDLQRSAVAYYLIKWLAKLFSNSYLVKHDAPLSVARGLKKKEWRDLLKKSNLSNFIINWKWAFRYLVIYKHE